MHTVRFGSTNKTLQLSEEQLIHVPYLSVLIMHTDDFQCGRNENGEYVLNSRIRFKWFNAIFKATLSGKISTLFTELPEEANVLGMLQLYDYLCMDPIPVPILKDQYLVQLKGNDSINDNKNDVKYNHATDAEARDTAVQFMIALSKHEYNVEDSQILKTIFQLLMAILLRPETFGVRLCHHAFTITKKEYISIFSPKQQHQLYKSQQCMRNDERQSLSTMFPNVFRWKGSYFLIKENSDENVSSWFNINSSYDTDFNCRPRNDSFSNWRWHYLDWPMAFRGTAMSNALTLPISYRGSEEENKLWFTLRSTMSEADLYALRSNLRERASLIIRNPEDKELHIFQIKEERKKMEARSARSERFNTLCNRFTTDKFKHRYGPKVKKYR